MAMSGPSGGGRDEDEAQAFVDINITPLTDVILVLLVIFMVASTAIVESERAGRRASPSPDAGKAEPRHRGLPIDLPQSTLSEPIEVDSTPLLVLSSGGAIELEGRTVSRADLRTALASLRASKPGNELVLAASGGAAHSDVVALLEAARRAGFSRVVIGTAGGSSTETADAGTR